MGRVPKNYHMDILGILEDQITYRPYPLASQGSKNSGIQCS